MDTGAAVAEAVGDGAVESERLLSVVVIARNEADRIGDCLESIFDACEPLDRFEVILADSRSTDGTVAIASEYPITILRLPEEPPVSPTAGRYVGTQAASGDLLLFVDGDMVLQEGWLEDACRRVREEPTLGGVDGNIEGRFGGETAAADRPIDVLRGVALYDRAALEAAGGWDPSLRSNEDLDLSYRVADSGYRLLRLGTTVAIHPERDADSDKLRRWRLGYYHGRGELVGKYLARPRLLARMVRRHALYYLLAGWVLVGAVARLLSSRRPSQGWALASTAGLAGAATIRGPRWVGDRLLNLPLFFAGIALGIAARRRHRDGYPLDEVEVVQRHPPAGAQEPSMEFVGGNVG